MHNDFVERQVITVHSDRGPMVHGWVLEDSVASFFGPARDGNRARMRAVYDLVRR